jgi:DNA-binding NarL/FixJ family response regulator
VTVNQDDINNSGNPSEQGKQRPTPFISRVLLVDDHPLFMRGVRLTLEDKGDFAIVGTAETGEQALALAEQLVPDIILLDVNLPEGVSGFNICKQIKLRLPHIAVVMLSVYEDDEQLFQTVRAGASAYLSKDVPPQTLINVLSQVAAGQYVINDTVLSKPKLAYRVLHQFQSLAVEGLDADAYIFEPLTQRELEILDGVARGQSNKEIARGLVISDQTVKNHMTNIMRKLHANDRTQAVLIGLRQGWFKLPEKGS